METIKEAIDKIRHQFGFIDFSISDSAEEAFMEGIRFSEEWFEVNYGKNGCLSSESYQEMMDSLPIIVEYYDTEKEPFPLIRALTYNKKLINDGRELYDLLTNSKIYKFRPLSRR